MAFESVTEMQKRKANFYAAHDVIEDHNNRPNVSYQLDHNEFSLLVLRYSVFAVKVQIMF